MTIDDDLMRRLRDTWHAAEPPPATRTGDGPADLRPPPGTVAKGDPGCNGHSDPKHWKCIPAPGRPGWTRTTCRRCGVFVGYRPAEMTRRRG